MGLLYIANKLLQNPPRRGGLLSCSLQYAGAIPDAKKDKPGDQTGNIRQLLEDYNRNIKSIKSDVDLVNYTVSLFIQFLDTGMIAWLMYDPITDCYIPWILEGFNAATKKRILLPRDKIIGIITSSTLQEIPPHGMNFFKDYFDTDDFGKIKNIVILPFFYQDRLMGFLLTANFKQEYTTNTRFTTLFLNSPPVNVILGERFNKIVDLGKYNAHPGDELTGEMEKHLEYSIKNNTVFTILKLSLESVIAPVLAEDPKLNPIIIKEDVLLLLGQLFKHIGFVYNTGNGNCLFVLNKLRKLDIAILKDQLLKTMKSFFTEIIKTNNFDLDFQVYSYPGEGTAIQDMLSVIL